MQTQMLKAPAAYLYTDEPGMPQKQKDLNDICSDAVKAQLNLMDLTQNVNTFCASLERVQYLLALNDECVSGICGILALPAAAGAAVFICFLRLLADTGAWRYILWLLVAPVLLPQAQRA